MDFYIDPSVCLCIETEYLMGFRYGVPLWGSAPIRRIFMGFRPHTADFYGVPPPYGGFLWGSAPIRRIFMGFRPHTADFCNLIFFSVFFI
jgi:hypothetical protein